MTGQLLGHYRVLEQIGAGGMGEVYRARDERLGRDVALKLVRPSSTNDADRLRRFEQEARAAAALNHPNIVAIYDIGVHDGMPFIVSELLEGNTLRERLAGSPLSVPEVADYGLQIAHGLMAAHDKHIVHRDLKPENLFITRDHRVKILDFGIAKLIHPEGSSSMEAMTTQTKAGALLGTVAYMSPEQLRGKPVDARSDLFSLGAILYEMLTGRRAFRGETDVDTITAVLRETPPEVTRERANVPKAFEQIVNHCLEKEPEKRFQTVRDLIFSLETLSSTGSASRSVQSIGVPSSLQKALLGTLVLATMVGCGWLLHRWSQPAVSNPEFQRLTYERGTVYTARFESDGRTVVYEGSWNGRPAQLFSTISTSPQVQVLETSNAHMLALSRSNELALQLHGKPGAFLDLTGGTLARAPLAGGSPRELLQDVRWADWDPKGELAVVHHVLGRSRLEYPIGKILYESPGWITNVRFAPSGDLLAFIDHPALWDDRGFVRVVDRAAQARRLSSDWETAGGLAWNPSGQEVWFTATKAGYNRRLMAVTLAGVEREVLATPDGLDLQDIAPDGRVLVVTGTPRVGLETIGPSDHEPQDLSWYNWSVARDISRDGQWVLFEESSEPFEGHYAVAARRVTGSPPIHLGDGSAGGLSPDGKWALDVSTSDPPRVTLLPLGPGDSRNVPLPGLEHVQNGPARFMPDGEHIIVNGNQAGRPVRGYLVDLAGGKPRPVTPEGIASQLISADGRYVTAQGIDSSVVVCSVETGKIEKIAGLEPGDNPAQWSQDSSALYVYRYGEVPARIFHMDIRTGKRTLVRELQSREHAGVISIAPIIMSRDASRFVYSYFQSLSTLYVISGLR
ncbi:MAG TPA: protein kinase [Terriglobales bacterium]|jgi:serine/threonine protein kinase/Tol biopolymer transport system component|nr:protein kinase [Terriglobales bacterium]